MNVKDLVRKNILDLKPYTSARDLYSEGILLDANENSIGSTVESAEQLNRYPDPHHKELRNRLGEYLGIQPERLIFGNGSDELIDLLIRIFCEPARDKVMILQPTYGMYKVACDINNVGVTDVSLDKDFDIDTDAVKEALDENTKMIFLCSPNNPTGNLLDPERIQKLCKMDTIVIVDEAYIDFCENFTVAALVNKYPNLVVLRTFSKAWGLSGVRCGYAIADEFIIDLLRRVKAPYNVNKLTMKAVLTGLENSAGKDKFVSELNSERAYLLERLAETDEVSVVAEPDANFILFHVKNSTFIRNYLAGKGVIIRERHFPGLLESCIRVTVGTRKENERFLQLLKEAVCTKQ